MGGAVDRAAGDRAVGVTQGVQTAPPVAPTTVDPAPSENKNSQHMDADRSASAAHTPPTSAQGPTLAAVSAAKTSARASREGYVSTQPV